MRYPPVPFPSLSTRVPPLKRGRGGPFCKDLGVCRALSSKELRGRCLQHPSCKVLGLGGKVPGIPPARSLGVPLLQGSLWNPSCKKLGCLGVPSCRDLGVPSCKEPGCSGPPSRDLAMPPNPSVPVRTHCRKSRSMSRSCRRENSRNSPAGLKTRRPPPPGEPSFPTRPSGLPGPGPGSGARPRRPASSSAAAAMLPGWPLRPAPPRRRGRPRGRAAAPLPGMLLARGDPGCSPALCPTSAGGSGCPRSASSPPCVPITGSAGVPVASRRGIAQGCSCESLGSREEMGLLQPQVHLQTPAHLPAPSIRIGALARVRSL